MYMIVYDCICLYMSVYVYGCIISIVMIILHHRGHNHFVHYLGQPKLLRAGTVTRLRFSLVKSLSQSLRSSWTLCSERSRTPFTWPSFTSMVKKWPQSLRLLTSAETSQLPMIFKMDLAQKPAASSASQSPFLLVDESWVSLIVIGHTQKVRNLSEPHRALFQRLFFLFTCNLYIQYSIHIGPYSLKFIPPKSIGRRRRKFASSCYTAAIRSHPCDAQALRKPCHDLMGPVQSSSQTTSDATNTASTLCDLRRRRRLSHVEPVFQSSQHDVDA
jgi:hypothetical protein